jgi:dipeptidyl aminopeptidase/acylaminoacyl peptidase
MPNFDQNFSQQEQNCHKENQENSPQEGLWSEVSMTSANEVLRRHGCQLAGWLGKQHACTKTALTDVGSGEFSESQEALREAFNAFEPFIAKPSGTGSLETDKDSFPSLAVKGFEVPAFSSLVDKEGVGFFYDYVQKNPPSSVSPNRIPMHGTGLYYHSKEDGSDFSKDRLVFGQNDINPRPEYSMEYLIRLEAFSDNHPQMLIRVDRELYKNTDWYIQDRTVAGTRVPLFEGRPGRYEIMDRRGSVLYFSRVTDSAPSGEIVKLELGDKKKPKVTPVIGEKTGYVIDQAKMIGDSWLVTYRCPLRGGSLFSSSLYTRARDGTFKETELNPLIAKINPSIGRISKISLDGEAKSLAATLVFETFDAKPQKLSLEVSPAGEVRVAQQTSLKSLGIVTSRVSYKSGSREVPMLIIHANGQKLQKSPPLLCGPCAVDVPRNSPIITAWIKKGGFVAIPLVQGSPEFGRKWCEAPREGKKHMDARKDRDLVLAAEALRELYDVPDRGIAYTGRSHGGHLGAYLRKNHPEYFGAIFSYAANMDSEHAREHWYGSIWYRGKGDDSSKTVGLDKDHLVVDYRKHNKWQTPILIMHGDNDDCVQALQSRLGADAAQYANPENEVLYLELKGEGHSPSAMRRNKELCYYDLQVAYLWDRVMSNRK